MSTQNVSKSNVNFQVDSNLKREAQEVLSSMDLNLSTFLKAKLREVVNTREFSVKAPEPVPNETTLLAMEELKSDKTSKVFTSIDDLLADVDD